MRINENARERLSWEQWRMEDIKNLVMSGEYPLLVEALENNKPEDIEVRVYENGDGRIGERVASLFTKMNMQVTSRKGVHLKRHEVVLILKKHLKFITIRLKPL